MGKILRAGGSLLLMTLIVLSCEEKKGIVESKAPFAIQEFEIPEILSTLSRKPVLVTAKVTHPEGNAGIQQVWILLPDFNGQGTDTLQLWDDGGNQAPHSGDVVAFDGVYSRLIIPKDQWNDSLDGEFQASIRAISKVGEVLERPPRNLKLFPNQPPEIVNMSFPDSIPAGMKPVQVTVTVNDNDGLDDVRWVLVEGFGEDSSFVAFRDTIANRINSNSPVFTTTIDSGFGAKKKGGYTLKFFAEDQVGEYSNEKTDSVYIENTAPLLVWVSVPDTLILPPSGLVVVDTILTKVTDRQSLLDIRSVTTRSVRRKPDGTLGDPYRLKLFDDGNQGDVLPGDGIFSSGIVLVDTNKTGTYIFTFKAEDFAENFSNELKDSIVVVSQ